MYSVGGMIALFRSFSPKAFSSKNVKPLTPLFDVPYRLCIRCCHGPQEHITPYLPNVADALGRNEMRSAAFCKVVFTLIAISENRCGSSSQHHVCIEPAVYFCCFRHIRVKTCAFFFESLRNPRFRFCFQFRKLRIQYNQVYIHPDLARCRAVV